MAGCILKTAVKFFSIFCMSSFFMLSAATFGYAQAPEPPQAPPYEAAPENSVSEEYPQAPSESQSQNVWLIYALFLACGWSLYANFRTSKRLDNIEKITFSTDSYKRKHEFAPFSWNLVLRSFEGGLPFLPGVRLAKPGLVLLTVDDSNQKDTQDPDVISKVMANVVHNVVSDPELVALTLTKTVAPDTIGRSLLSLNSGCSWGNLDSKKQQMLLEQKLPELSVYEKSLFCLMGTSFEPAKLFAICQEFLQEADLGVLLMDSLDSVQLDEDSLSFDNSESSKDINTRKLEHLRLIANRCYVPICFVTKKGSQLWNICRDNPVFTAELCLRLEDMGNNSDEENAKILPVTFPSAFDISNNKYNLSKESGQLKLLS